MSARPEDTRPEDTPAAAPAAASPAAGEMASRYEPGQVEGEIRAAWEKSGANTAGRDEATRARTPYTIMIPPPNVTGVLHMGHALNGTIQDIVIRHRRMTGHDALWLPGTDHAGIATQAVVEKTLYAESKQTRKDIGREAFLEQVWAWRKQHGDQILEQFKRLGSSCDWTRTAFTLDPPLSRAVREAFVRLWEKGLIYRGPRLVNWDCVLQTAVGDDEIEYVPRKGKLWHLRYPVEGEEGRHVTVATTRPETMLGDTGVAVHPDDARYADLVGKTLVLPLLGRKLKVVADASVDKDFGSGAVKVTPGHDPADYERGARHGLPVINILNKDGTLNENAGPYAGMPREKAREAVVAALEEQGLLGEIEDIEHNVSVSDRSKSPIEPLVSEQWFVKMAPLAEPAIAAVKNGQLRFKPERWSRVYLDWLENVRDWCISRQLWWGHRIPVWYDEAGVPVASREDLELGAAHPQTGKPLVRQDEDVLDTWASSWLWPLATLGWPDRVPDGAPDLARYYPTQFLSTASEIIYLWVARMVMAGYAFADHLPVERRCPFETVYIHATVLDAQGRRMSKSLGNGIDPVEMIDTYGADAVRFSLILLTKEGQDTKLSPEKFEQGRNFVNKLWNASRFVLSRTGRLPALDVSQVTVLEDRWILSRLRETVASVSAAWERYEFNDAATTLYRFTWNDVCDWYVEAVKPRLGAVPGATADGGGASAASATEPDPVAAGVLGRVLTDVLALLHPIAPFVTEAVWKRVREASDVSLPPLLMLAPWPDASDLPHDARAEAEIALAQSVVSSVRKLRQQNNVAERKPVKVTVALPDAEAVAGLQRAAELVARLGFVERLDVATDPQRPSGAAVDLTEGIEVLLDLDGLVDRAAQAEDLRRNLAKLDKQLAGIRGKLANENFVSRAPEDVVARERSRLEELGAERTRVEELLAGLQD
ncbi:MAG: valine--tRNA ligase [Planctomycetota bacterium]|jgi:valyl-tRNA synthetase